MPRTAERATVELSRQQRLAIYDRIVDESRSVRKVSLDDLEELSLDIPRKQEEMLHPKSLLEILAEQRDYKRRRQSYRAKNVHITKKSYTEIMREVIQTQMEFLNPCLEEQLQEATPQVDVAGGSEVTRSAVADDRTPRWRGSRESSEDSRRKRHRSRDQNDPGGRHHRRSSSNRKKKKNKKTSKRPSPSDSSSSSRDGKRHKRHHHRHH